MNLTPIKIFLQSSGKWIAKHSPTILTVVGSGGVITSTVMAVRATPRAMKKLEAKKKELGKDKLTVKETIQTCWKDYIPTAGVAVGTICCFAGVNAIHLKHQAALAGLYSIAEQGLLAKDRELSAIKDEMVKAVGEDKAKEIQEKVQEKKNDRKNDISVRANRTYMFRFAGQFFESTPHKIWQAEHRLMRRLHGGFEMYMSLNSILDELDLEPDPIYGNDMFVTIDDGIEFRFCETGFTDDGELYIQLGMEVPPHAL